MTAKTFVQPDFTSQDAAAYKAAIDTCVAVLARMSGGFAPHAQSTPDMTIKLDAGSIPGSGAVATEVSAQNTGTITAPSANPRIDVVYVDQLTGVIGVATGAEAASPSTPVVPSGKVGMAKINLVVSQTEIANADIEDVRAVPLAGGGVPTGSLMDFAGSAEPDGWVFCDGASYDSVADPAYAGLYAVIGTTYGGSGASAFNVPDFRGRVSIGKDNLGGTSANRITHANADTLGGAGGTETHTLSSAEMPSHTHTGPSHTHTGPSHTHTGPSHTHKIGGYGVASDNVVDQTTLSFAARLATQTVAADGTGATGAGGTGATSADGTGATGSAARCPTTVVISCSARPPPGSPATRPARTMVATMCGW